MPIDNNSALNTFGYWQATTFPCAGEAAHLTQNLRQMESVLLTTPPCSQNLRFILYKTAIRVT